MAYTGGAVTDLKVVRTGPTTFNIEFTVPDDGAGSGARVQVRSANASAGDWWWSRTSEGVATVLLTTTEGTYGPGTYVVQPVSGGQDLDGVQTYFQAVASDFALSGYSPITPPVPGLLVDFGTWTEPAPEPEPEPEPDPTPDSEPTTDPPRDVTLKEGRVELWRPVPWIPTPWGTMTLFIGKRLPEEP